MIRRKRKRYRAYLHSSNEPIPRTTQQRIQKAHPIPQDHGSLPESIPSTSTSGPGSEAATFFSGDEQSSADDKSSPSSSNPCSESDNSERMYVDNSDSEAYEKSQSEYSNSIHDSDSETPIESPSDDDSEFIDAEGHPKDEGNLLFKFQKYKESKHFQHLQSPMPNPSESKSIFEILFLIFHFSMRHNLSKVAVEDLIKMMNCILGTEVIPHSKYTFWNTFFSGINRELHLYCHKCSSYLGPMKEQNQSVSCSTCLSENLESSDNDIKSFASVSMKDQLQLLLENPYNQKKIRENFVNRGGNQEGVVKDIYGGKSYKKLYQQGVLNEEFNISITINIDGAPVFKSSKGSIWPIQFICNELPPEDRFEPNNVMLAGLWYGKEDPKMSVFLIPFIKEALDLSINGFEWTNENGEEIKTKVSVLNCCVDSVAKPIIQGVKQFNGYYGCGYCLHPGVGVEGTNQVRYVMPADSPEGYDYRTDSSMKADAKEAIETGKPKNGVKTISPLSALPNFDLVFGFTIDYMHACLLGVSRLLANLWFDTKNHNEEYYIGLSKGRINDSLSKITPTSEVTRHPRSMQERKHWKANEWRSWLLFYSLPCLQGILPTRYFNHYVLYVTAMFMFLKDEVTHEEIDLGNMLLMNFVVRFQELYGDMNMVYNVHLLTHMGKIVSLWGPLWAYSAFTFESGNGTLLKLVRGTRGVSSQIVEKYLSYKSVQLWLKVHNVSPSVLNFCSLLMSFPLNKTVTYNPSETVLLGNPKKEPLTISEQAVLQNNGYDPAKYEFCYKRIIHKGKRLSCTLNKRQKSICDNCVLLSGGGFVYIQRFLKIEGNVFMIVKTISVTNRKVFKDNIIKEAVIEHISLCNSTNLSSLQPVNNIREKCISMNIAGNQFIAKFPNVFEKD